MLELEREIEVVGRRPSGDDTGCLVLFHALRHVADDRRVAGIVELVVAAGHPDAEVIGQRAARGDIETAFLVTAVGHVQAAFPNVARLARDDVDCAGGRALTGESWLGASDDFYALEIEYRSLAQIVAAVIDRSEEHTSELQSQSNL